MLYVERCGCENHGDLYNIVFGMERGKIEAGLKRKLFGWYQKKKFWFWLDDVNERDFYLMKQKVCVCGKLKSRKRVVLIRSEGKI